MLNRLNFERAMRVIIVAGLAGTSCAPAVEMHALPPETVLFDVLSVNYAWGFQCSGCYVDAAGRVHRYNCNALRDTIDSGASQASGSILVDMRDLVKDSVVCRVRQEELARMKAFAPAASLTPPGEEVQTAADAGSTKYFAFMYDSTGSGREVLLSAVGDFSRAPSSGAADTLVNWLRRACACKNATAAE